MTRFHALNQLLRLGPLTLREIIAITGWPSRVATDTLLALKARQAVRSLNLERRRHYVATAGRLDGPGDPPHGPAEQGRAATPRPHGSSRQGPHAGNSHRPFALLREVPKGVK